MEDFGKVNINVFKNTGYDKKILLNTVQSFIQSHDSDNEIAVVQSTGYHGKPILEEFFSKLGFKMDGNCSAEKELSREDFPERSNTMPELTFRLYNCDNMYDLDKVEALITKVTAKMTQKAKIEKNYFPLPQMKNLCRKLEREGKQKCYAVFVVHADEPGLVINSATSVAGYSMLYRTLVRLTDDRVLIVIGGDDGYKEEERDKSVLSRRVLNMVCSQFNKKYLNGVKSFVFSWEENHHPIHEEALEFYLDPEKQGQEFVPLPKTESPCLALPEGDEQKDAPPTEKEHQEKDDISEATPDEAQAAAKTPRDFHVLSFYSKEASVTTVETLLADVSKKLNFACQTNSPYLLPRDFPQHIKENKPEYVFLVSEMKDFKNIQHLDSWVQLYRDILESIVIVDKTLVFVVCGDTASKDHNLISDFIREQFVFLNSSIMPPTKVLVLSWNNKPCTVHHDALLHLLNPTKGAGESWPAETELDPKKGRLRYRARIRYGQVARVLESDPPGWKPEESMLKQQLDRNKDLIRGFLEFWENKEGNITAVVLERVNPVSQIFDMYGLAFRKSLFQPEPNS